MVRIISALILAVTAFGTSATEPLQLVDNPPDRHIVVRGDTLWGISGKFLRQPWRWPEIWQMNRDEIRNPHRIYPGDIIVLDTSGGLPRLKMARPLGQSSGKLQPTVHSTPVQQIVPSIPPNVIEPFVSQPRIVDSEEYNATGMIVATEEDRMMVGTGDNFFASGIPDARVEKWHIFRKGKPLRDPDTGEVVAHEAYFLGNARLVRPGEPATLRVTLAKEEISRGDRLLPAPDPEIIAYVPHRPDQAVTAKVLSIYGGVNEGGTNSVVALNLGKSDQLEIGHVLALFRNRVASSVDSDGRRSLTAIPEERYGLAFVFRVFDRVAYALVVDSSKSVIVGDTARNP